VGEEGGREDAKLLDCPVRTEGEKMLETQDEGNDRRHNDNHHTYGDCGWGILVMEFARSFENVAQNLLQEHDDKQAQKAQKEAIRVWCSSPRRTEASISRKSGLIGVVENLGMGRDASPTAPAIGLAHEDTVGMMGSVEVRGTLFCWASLGFEMT